jgi:hypothetical protein
MPTFREDIRLGTKVPQMKTEDYEDRSVTTEKLANEAVTSEKLGTGAVLRDNIQDGAVGTDEIANYSVTTEKLHDEAVTESKLAEHAVTSSILGNGAVERVNIQEGAVGSNEIENNAITIEKIAQAVWDKLKDEYLRLDGGNSMKNTLDMGGNSIDRVNSIESNSSSPVFINLRNAEVTIGANDDEDQGVSVPQWVTIWRDTSFYGNVEAAGFKTHDRSKLGLLNNNGGVAKPLNSGEIQQCFLVAFG